MRRLNLAFLAILLVVVPVLSAGMYLVHEYQIKKNAQVLLARARRALAGCDLRLVSSVQDVSDIPTGGKDLVVVAAADDGLHFRMFDGHGNAVVDSDEKRLTDHARQIEDLRKRLAALWPPHELTESEKVPVITAVTSIVGHSPDRH